MAPAILVTSSVSGSALCPIRGWPTRGGCVLLPLLKAKLHRYPPTSCGSSPSVTLTPTVTAVFTSKPSEGELALGPTEKCTLLAPMDWEVPPQGGVEHTLQETVIRFTDG